LLARRLSPPFSFWQHTVSLEVGRSWAEIKDMESPTNAIWQQNAANRQRNKTKQNEATNMQQEQQQRSAQNYTIYAIYEQDPSPSGVQ